MKFAYLAQKTNFLIIFVILLILLRPAAGFAQSELPAKARIRGVAGHAQKYPLSCESRSAVDWAAYWGVEISEKKFLKSLPRSDNPEKGFVGQPGDQLGHIPPASYGVHAGPVAEVLRTFGLDAQAQRDMDWDQARSEIAAGRPVIVWVIGEMWAGTPRDYVSSDGETSIVAAYEHTMILVGYTTSTVIAIDPATGLERSYPLRSFLSSWNVLDRMAVTGEKNRESAQPVSEPDFENPPPEEILAIEDATTATESQDSAKVYIVRRGNSLTRIAKRLGVNWRALARLNNLGTPYIIYAGQRLQIP